jgi:tetratricopeptide (TPR) repeat protein
MSSKHLDDFTLLRYAVSDLDGPERGAADDHLQACGRCMAVLGSVEKLDRELRGITNDFAAADGLDPSDPFARRPEAPPRPNAVAPIREGESLAIAALEASERAGRESGRILEAAKGSAEELDAFLSGLSVADLAVRFALLYALQESGRKIAESPLQALALALAALHLFRGDDPADSSTPAGRILPRKAIAAQAHLLAGQARIWTGELERSRSHLEQAYSAFGDSTGDDTSLAIVELGESQRRAFAGDPNGAFVLARRALATFEEMGLEDFMARGRVAEGICLTKLDRLEEALEAYRSALPVFRKHELWSNYVGAVNAIGATLSMLGRLDEARREYARALKVVSRKQHAAWVGYIRNGLALVLFKAGHYRDAALAFLQTSRLFWEVGNIANALTASLYEIESLVLCGEADRAARRFEIFRAEAARHDALDPIIVRQLEAALSGSHPDLEEVAALRESAGQMLRERLEMQSRA